MPAYHYIALNQQQKELSGIIEAPDEASARKKLNEINLSVVSLNAARDAAHAESKTKFEFEALDKNNKKVVGTIAADDIIKAYARLFEEYQLNVTAIFAASLAPQEKQAAKKTGILEIQKKYQLATKTKPKEADETEKLSQAQMAERAELLEKVAFTTERMEVFIKEFGPDLKTEERDQIQSYLNQLIRIKDSTNLEHIRSTCERMLSHIQKQELFIHEDQKLRESAKLKIEMKDMLTQLKHTGLKQEISIIGTAAKWQKNPFLKPVADIILKIFGVKNPEIRKLKNDIKVINSHIFSYAKLLIIGKTRMLKTEAWESIKTLRKEKRRIKLQIAALKIEERKTLTEQREPNYFWQNAGSVIGWILAFYILSYIVAYPFTIKIFSIPPVPKSFYFYHSNFIKSITLFLFIAYGAITVRNFWFSKYWSAPYILYPISIFGFLLIVINLM